MGEDPARLLRLALVNESLEDWEAALGCLEAAAATADAAVQARVVEAASRLEGVLAKKPALRDRARSLARGVAAKPGTVVPQRAKEPAPARPLPSRAESDIAIARELLVTPDVVRALRKAFEASASGGDERGRLTVPVESILSRLLGCELDLAKAIDLALDLVLEATGAARGCMLVRDERGRLELSRGRGLERSELPAPLSTSILAEAERTGAPVFVDDAARDPRFERHASVKGQGLRSVACVPVFGESGDATPTLLGIIYIDDPRASGRFDERARELLDALARAIAAPLRNALRFEAQRRTIRTLRGAARTTPARIVGRAPATVRLVELLSTIAPAPAPVLIEGESGTGKELAARVLHELSPGASARSWRRTSPRSPRPSWRPSSSWRSGSRAWRRGSRARGSRAASSSSGPVPTDVTARASATAGSPARRGRGRDAARPSLALVTEGATVTRGERRLTLSAGLRTVARDR